MPIVTEDFRPEVGFWLMQMVRGGPFVPVRIWWCDHEPGNPENKLDRGALPFLAAEVAGEWYDPRNSVFNEPILELCRERQLIKPGHWREPIKISASAYLREVASIQSSRELGRNSDPRLRPFRRIKPAKFALPSFVGDHP